MLRAMNKTIRNSACALMLTAGLVWGAHAQGSDRFIVAGVLAAEFAFANGDIATASQAYVELARRSQDSKVAERAVDLLLRHRDFDQAKEITALWLRADPTSTRANQISLALALNGNDLVAAERAIAHVGSFPADKRGAALFDLSRQLAQMKDRDAAVKLASVAISKFPELAESHYALAVATTGTTQSRVGEALLAIDRALSLRPAWPEAVAVKARLLVAKAEAASTPGARALAADESVTLLQTALAANPESRELKQLLARQLFDLGRPKEARALFVDLADDGKADVEEMQLSATLAAYAAEDWDTAEKELLEALAKERGDANAIHYYLGRIADVQKRWAVAAERYEKVERRGQGDRYWESQLRIAHAYAAEKRLLQAVSHLKRLQAQTPIERVTLAQTESAIWREAGDLGKAFDALDAGLQTLPDNADLLYDSAMLAERLSRMDDAERRLRRVMEIEPKRAHAYNALGYSFADRNTRLDEAQQLIEKALELAPEDAAIIDSMGWVLFRQGRLKEAEEHLRRAYSKFKDGEIAAHLGEVLWAQGRKDEARGLWRDQLKAQPDSDILKRTIERLDSK